jgi:hypothetical protein
MFYVGLFFSLATLCQGSVINGRGKSRFRAMGQEFYFYSVGDLSGSGS